MFRFYVFSSSRVSSHKRILSFSERVNHRGRSQQEKTWRYYSQEKETKREEKKTLHTDSPSGMNWTFWAPVGGVITLGGFAWLWDRYGPPPAERSERSWKQWPLSVRLAIFGSLVGLLGAFTAVGLPFVWVGRKSLGGIPFVPATPRQIDRMLRVLPLRRLQGKELVDLGSGDGRVVVEGARRGLVGTGWELNPFLLARARRRAQAAGVTDAVTWHRGNLWEAPLESVAVVTVYGVPGAMERFSARLSGELSPGAYVVTLLCPLPRWAPLSQEEGVTLYRLPDSLPPDLRSAFTRRTAHRPSLSPPYDPLDCDGA